MLHEPYNLSPTMKTVMIPCWPLFLSLLSQPRQLEWAYQQIISVFYSDEQSQPRIGSPI